MSVAVEPQRAIEPAPDVTDGSTRAPNTSSRLAETTKRGPFRPERLASVRQRLNMTTLVRRFRTLDGAVLGVAAWGALKLTSPAPVLAQPMSAALPLALAVSATVLGLRSVGAYRFGAREPLWTRLARLTVATLGGALALTIGAWVFSAAAAPSATTWTMLAALLLGASQTLAWALMRRWRREGKLTPNIVVVGANANAARLIETALATREVAVLGVFDDRLGRAPASIHGVPVLGDTHALLDHKILPYVDRIVITVSAASQARISALIDRLRVLPNAVTLLVDVDGEREQAQVLARLTDAPLTQVSGRREDEGRVAAKRLQDVALALLALVVALPVMAVVALAVRLDSPGPILFRQRRYGFNNEPITILKFRSMRAEVSDHASTRQVEADDPRVTRVGRFLRQASLDELPQLFNVLTGEMSMVGPRPHAIGMQTAGEDANRLVAEYAWRNRMKPGITGWAQINGSRGPVDTAEAVRRRVALDIDYIERQSLSLDLYILLMTLPRLLGDAQAIR